MGTSQVNSKGGLWHFIAASITYILLASAPASAHAQGALPNIADLIARCAPTVHPETMTALMNAESSGHQFAIADAGPVKLPWSQRKHLVRSFYMSNLSEAVAKARGLMAQGHTVSLGLLQVNDRNLPKLGIKLEEIFDLCTNIRAGGEILTNDYLRAVKMFGPGERAMRAALSFYNSGDAKRGEADGYVDLVYGKANKPFQLKTTGPIVPRLGQRTTAAAPQKTARAVQAVPRSVGRREFSLVANDYVVR